MVAQDCGLVAGESVGDALALFGIEHHTGVVVEQGVVLVEGAGVLGDRVECATQRRPRLAVHRVGVRGADDVGAGRVHLGVNGERGLVHRQIAFDDGAVVTHQQQVADPNVAEVHAERVHPEVVGEFRVACGDVPGHALVEAELAEQPERRGEVLLAVQTFLFGIAFLRQQC